MVVLNQIKAVVLVLFLLIFCLLPVGFLSIPFSLERRLKIICPVWQFCSRMLLRYACHAKVSIQEDHRSEPFRGTPPYGLYVANHQSYIDIPLLITVFQAPPIMKKVILYVPIFGQLGWISGALPVSRSKVGSRKKIFSQAKRRILHDKIGLQVYPEGTRSKDAIPKPFEEIKRTLLVFAFKEQIPVIPCSMYGTRGVLSQKGFIKTGRHLGVIVHKELLPQDYENADKFSRAVWEKVISGHDEMKSRLGPLNENLS